VRHTVDKELVEQVRVFSLRFACEDCLHFDAEGARCVHGYSERPSAGALDKPGGGIAFCKEFELGKRDEP
jgi:hypothetical protein